MRSRRRLLSDHEGTREIWPAFTDVMSTMALILFVLVLLSYVRSLVSSKQLDAFQRQIALSEEKLRSLGAELHRTSAEVESSKAKLDAQQAVIDDTTRQLGDVRTQLQSIAVLRVGVLDRLRKAIEAELGTTTEAGTPLVTIGDTGDILLNERLLFETGSYAIKKEAKPLIDGLARALGNVLADDGIRDNIDTIVIQGHTDERGSSATNWDLSARRATAVLEALFQSNPTLADSYGSFFSASAYSKFRPVDPGTTDAAYQQNRRIEISVVPKDANVRKVIDAYMASHAPGAAPPPAPPPSP
ncbi:MAG TPA: OmpA family protein [Polyangiaceae bacterium]